MLHENLSLIFLLKSKVSNPLEKRYYEKLLLTIDNKALTKEWI